jgi:hypothetical protein
MLVANEHSMSSFPQPLYDTHVIAVVLEGTLVDATPHAPLHALKLCRSFDVVAKSGDGYEPSPPMACPKRIAG